MYSLDLSLINCKIELNNDNIRGINSIITSATLCPSSEVVYKW